jgi:hypothetical protein
MTNWIKFKYNNIEYEVQNELNPKVKYKEIIIPEGCELMTIEMVGFLFDNKIIKIRDWEWIEHYSKKTKKL